MPLLTPEQLLVALAEPPRRIAAVTVDASETELQSQPSPEAWSAREVLAHLRSCADVWGGCIARILDEDAPTIYAVNPRTWIERTDYASSVLRAHDRFRGVARRCQRRPKTEQLSAAEN